MKLSKKLLTVIMCIGLLFSNTAAFAHSGRTDSSGGHHDYNNVSGLGSYHYHHGMGPHLHPNGICPYSSSSSSTARSNATVTKKTSKYYRSSTVKKVQKKLNKLGHKCGKADGVFGKKTKNAIKKFQKEEGLSVNGNINKTLLKKLKINI